MQPMRLWHRLRTPTTLLNAALLVLTLAAAFWAYRTVSGGTTAAAATGQRERVVAVTQGTVSATVSASGTVQSATTASASFVTSGTVTEIAVKVGDSVAAGQVLAKVDRSAVQDTLDTAEANLTAARQALSRAKSNGSDDATIASLNASVATAQASADAAQRAVDGTVLKAPIAGTVIAVNGTVGSPSTTSNSANSTSTGFLQIADLTKLQISASFAEADATKLRADQAATVTWSALSGARATAKVTTIAPTATTSNNVNTYAVVATLDTVPAGARIGQSVTMQVTVASVADVVRVPTAAVRSAGGQRTVLVRTAAGDEARAIRVGVEGDQFTEVTSGLTAGEQVVIVTSTGNTNTNQNFPGGGQFTGGGGQFPGGGGAVRQGGGGAGR